MHFLLCSYSSVFSQDPSNPHALCVYYSSLHYTTSWFFSEKGMQYLKTFFFFPGHKDVSSVCMYVCMPIPEKKACTQPQYRLDLFARHSGNVYTIFPTNSTRDRLHSLAWKRLHTCKMSGVRPQGKGEAQMFKYSKQILCERYLSALYAIHACNVRW